MARNPNILFLNVQSGESKTIPEGFIIASFNPAEGASYTITNSQNGDIGDNLKISSSISIPFTTPVCPVPDGYAEHRITASGGSILVAYIN